MSSTTSTTVQHSPLKSPDSWGYTEIRSELEWCINTHLNQDDEQDMFLNAGNAIVHDSVETLEDRDDPVPNYLEQMEAHEANVPEENVQEFERLKRLVQALASLNRESYTFEMPGENRTLHIAVYDVTDKSQAIVYKQSSSDEMTFGLELPRDVDAKLDTITDGYEQVSRTNLAVDDE